MNQDFLDRRYHFRARTAAESGPPTLLTVYSPWWRVRNKNRYNVNKQKRLKIDNNRVHSKVRAGNIHIKLFLFLSLYLSLSFFFISVSVFISQSLSGNIHVN